MFSHVGSVLVVEDDPLIAMDIAETFTALGCREVRVALGVVEAIEELVAQSADLVTMDVKLGPYSCESVVGELRRRGIPYVYLTGCERSDCPDDVAPRVAKPIPKRALVEAVLSVAPALQEPVRSAS